MSPPVFPTPLSASAYLHPTAPSPWDDLRAQAANKLVEIGCDYDTLIAFPVDWALDQDPNNHVSNGSYTRYGNVANIRLIESYASSVGDDIVARILRGENEIGPVAKDLVCRYKRAAKYPDMIVVGSRLEEMRKEGWKAHFIMISAREQHVVAECTSWSIFINFKTGEKVDLCAASEPYSSLYRQLEEKMKRSQEVLSKHTERKEKESSRL